MDSDLTIHALYDWTCRVEDEVLALKSCFPDVLAADRNRLIMSIHCLRISLEIRCKTKDGRRRMAAHQEEAPPPFPRRRATRRVS